MSSGKVLLGLLAGFTAGTLLGTLFASNNGDAESRNHFWNNDRDVNENEEKFNQVIEDITDKFEDLKEEIVYEKSNAKGN